MSIVRIGSFLFLLLVYFTLSSCFKTFHQFEDEPVKHISLPADNPNKNISVIAFGSCNKHDAPQPMWSFIKNQNPDLWIWLGDNIYGDTEDMVIMNQKYNYQLRKATYQNFIKDVPVIGVWDDHDFGKNNAGFEFAAKKESQRLMLNFFNVPQNAPQRKQDGVYSAYTFGEDNKKVKVILLDSRYFREAPKSNGTILGETQWLWLENELQNNDATITIIGNGIQVIPAEHRFEKWQNFPNERDRLFELIEKSNLTNVVLISGDRHIGEISKMKIGERKQALYEVTSSGLTHSYALHNGKEPNQHRLGKIVSDKNYGLIKIDWNTNPPNVELSINGLDDVVFEKFVVEN